MRWRKYPKEKPAGRYDDPVYCYCCDYSGGPKNGQADFLGQLLYKPEYGMFFRTMVQVICNEVMTSEKPIKSTVTHFATEDDIILPGDVHCRDNTSITPCLRMTAEPLMTNEYDYSIRWRHDTISDEDKIDIYNMIMKKDKKCPHCGMNI